MGVKLNPFTGKLDVVDSPSGDFSTVELNQGTQTSPSISFDGDPNTGIYSPGADQLAISTNGTGRLFVDDTGSLTVTKSGFSGQIALFQGFNGLAEFKSTRSTGGSYTRINGTYAGNATDYWSIGSNGFTDGSFAIWAGAGNAERLRITSDGKLGLGTSTPLAPVHFASSVTGSDGDSKGVILSLVNTATAVAGTGSSVSFGCNLATSGTSVAVNIASIEGIKENGINGNFAGALKFVTRAHAGSPTERMRINSSGNVGIGTTSPSHPLVVRESSNVCIELLKSNDASILTIGEDGSGGAVFNAPNGTCIFQKAGSEKARIDSDGRLLVGTSSARSNFFNTNYAPAFQVEGSDGPSAAISIVRNADSGSGAVLLLGKTRSSSVGGNAIAVNGDSAGGIYFQASDGSELVGTASIASEVDGTPGANDMPGRLVFSTTADGASSPTERMRITNGGDILFGTTGIPNGTSVYGAAFESATNNRQILKTASSVTASDSLVAFYNPNGLVGTISVSGSATAYNTSSDYRLKENVVPLTGAVDRLNQLQVHRFNFIADPDTTVDGFLAHEAQAVVPECVTGTKDEVDDEGNPVYQGIDQSKLVPLLTAALQEALAKIEVLEQRLTDAGIA